MDRQLWEACQICTWREARAEGAIKSMRANQLLVRSVQLATTSLLPTNITESSMSTITDRPTRGDMLIVLRFQIGTMLHQEALPTFSWDQISMVSKWCKSSQAMCQAPPIREGLVVPVYSDPLFANSKTEIQNKFIWPTIRWLEFPSNSKCVTHLLFLLVWHWISTFERINFHCIPCEKQSN